MGTSGNPAKKAAETSLKVSSVKDIKKKKEGRAIGLPSGIVVRARRADLMSFLKQGDVPNPLIPLVEDAINKGKNVDMAEITGLGEGQLNMDLVNEMYEMVNNIVISVCVEPRVHPVPEAETDRDDDLLYIDEFEDEDKMFLFNWTLGGTEDIATFRQEAEEGLVSLAQG